MVKKYQELTVWQKAFALCLEVYRATKAFPRTELYGLTAQIRRAAVSIPSNIAEGFGRRTTPDFLRSLYIAYGSLCELETQVALAEAMAYLRSDDAANLRRSIGDVERLSKALIRTLEKKRLGTRPLEH